MNVRGAPAIAIVACLGLAIEIKGLLFQDKAANLDMQATVDDIKNKLSFLETSRPTAVNLKKSCDAIRGLLTNSSGKLLGEILLSIEEYAFQLFQDDFNVNKAIGKCGANAILDVPQEGSEAKSSVCVLTHCNTGSLATAGFGTALGVIRTLHELGKLERAYCTETRPYNQGARLTAYELLFEKIPSTLICDNMVGALMQTKTMDVERLLQNLSTPHLVKTVEAVSSVDEAVKGYKEAMEAALDVSAPFKNFTTPNPALRLSKEARECREKCQAATTTGEYKMLRN
eukprot:TCALIF_11230-PA protein Name:"Similar to GK22419 Methylthioribose-1-phosphate isomerase (Drosophila willistoni)" AED:0.27 eAED:0.30 QI:0/0/0/0.4/1/1/5/0/285